MKIKIKINKEVSDNHIKTLQLAKPRNRQNTDNQNTTNETPQYKPHKFERSGFYKGNITPPEIERYGIFKRNQNLLKKICEKIRKRMSDKLW